MKTRTTIVALSSIMAISSLASAATWHVKTAATGDGSGSNWDNAATLSFALANAASSDNIWVAAGIYKPANQGSSFLLDQPGVRVLGGFVGNETVEGQRNPNPVTNGCILSGDINNDDGPAAWQDYSDNCDHVVVADGLTSATEIDAFTIRGGNSTTVGGGITVGGGTTSLRILRCRIIENQALIEGGGIFCAFATFEIRASDVSNNRTTQSTGARGGGIAFKEFAGGNIVTTSLTNNNTGGEGGAIAAGEITNVFNCVIRDNVAAAGGGIAVSGASTYRLRVANAVIAQNAVTGVGGGIATGGQIPVEIRDCTLADNSASGAGGGGLYVGSSGATTIANSIFWGNTASSGAAQIAANGNPVTVDRSDVQGGWSGSGANNLNSNPVFVNASADNYRLGCASPCHNAGANSLIAADSVDLNLNGNFTEPVPYDLDIRARVVFTTVDMGAYENTVNLSCPANVDPVSEGSETSVNIDDLLLVISNWGPCPAGPASCPGDVAAFGACGSDGVVNIDDLLAVISNWGPCGGEPEDFPNGLMDCFNIYCNGTTGEEREICLQKCFEAYCTKYPGDCD